MAKAILGASEKRASDPSTAFSALTPTELKTFESNLIGVVSDAGCYQHARLGSAELAVLEYIIRYNSVKSHRNFPVHRNSKTFR